jgi:hypothetical protein
MSLENGSGFETTICVKQRRKARRMNRFDALRLKAIPGKVWNGFPSGIA